MSYRNTKGWSRLLVVVALAAALPSGARADDSATRGRQIAAEADRRVRGFGDYRARMEMTLSDRRGAVKVRKLEVATLEVSQKVSKSLVYFDSPRDIRGTALLTYSNRDDDDDQWLYLPALRRTKRIASSNRSTPFMGSELAYEDLSAQYVDDYRYEYLRNESYRQSDCFVVRRIPTYAGTGYSKQEVWIDTDEYRVLKVVSWDRDGKKLKTLIAGGYAKHLDHYWMPGEVRVVNHQTDARTTLAWSDYRFHAGLRDSDFSQSALRRTR